MSQDYEASTEITNDPPLQKQNIGIYIYINYI